MTSEVLKYECCLCGDEHYGYGNNPDPIKKEGKCCDDCNMSKVIPARFEVLKKMKQYGNNERNLHRNDK